MSDIADLSESHGMVNVDGPKIDIVIDDELKALAKASLDAANAARAINKTLGDKLSTIQMSLAMRRVDLANAKLAMDVYERIAAKYKNWPKLKEGEIMGVAIGFDDPKYPNIRWIIKPHRNNMKPRNPTKKAPKKGK